jgi:hypothetical protein
MTVMTFKLPDAMDHRLRVAAMKRNSSKSAIVRQAIQLYLDSDLTPAERPSVYDLVRDYIGTVEGPPDLSTNPAYMEGFGK